MIDALPRAWVLRGVTLVILTACAAAAWLALGDTTLAGQILKSAGVVGFVLNTLILILSWRPVFLWAYRLLRADLWWFPVIDGQWVAEGWSNWPRVERMMLAAAGKTEAFDALRDDLPDGVGKPVISDVTIEQSLFGIEMDLRPRGTNRVSVTRFIKPEWVKPGAPRITYVYDQEDGVPVAATDVSSHLGAGCLVYDKRADTLRGEYWTQRSRDKGLNTAGSITFRRKKMAVARTPKPAAT